MISTVILAAHIVICLAIIGLVLIQHGKGADAGAAFGSGASGTVFGSRGSASFLSRTTGVLAAAFFATSLVLAILAGTYTSGDSVVDGTGTLIQRDTAPADDTPDAPAESSRPSAGKAANDQGRDASAGGDLPAPAPAEGTSSGQ